MFFDNEIPTCHILDVIKLSQGSVNIFNSGRNFAALSFRTNADTVLKTEKSEHYVGTNSLAFVPTRLDYTRCSRRDELTVIHFELSDCRADEIEAFVTADPDGMSELFKDVSDCWQNKETGYRHRCTALLYQVLYKCYRENHKSESGSSRLAASVEYIRKHYTDKELSVKDIAAGSFMSEVYFRRLFKEKFGTSPRRYIIELRIQNAKRLISTGYYSLSEVADMSGYTDYKYFTVEFKRRVGVSPSEYSYNYRE